MTYINEQMSEKQAVNWNASIEFPSDSCFTNRIVTATFGPSKSSGNPMITLEMEVLLPETYEVGNQLVNIAGIKTKSYYSTKSFDEDGTVDEEGTANLRARIFVSTDPDILSLYERLGLDGSQEDPENPNVKQLEGKIVLTQMSSNPDPQRRTPTSEQIEKAKKAHVRPEGTIMKHPVTGKDLMKYWPKVDEIFALAPDQNIGSNKPYS